MPQTTIPRLGGRQLIPPRTPGMYLIRNTTTPPPVETFYRITPRVARVTTTPDDRTTTQGDDRVTAISYRRTTSDGSPRVWTH